MADQRLCPRFGKVMYPSRISAQRNARVRTGVLRPYHCGVCGAWHLTGKSRKPPAKL